MSEPKHDAHIMLWWMHNTFKDVDTTKPLRAPVAEVRKAAAKDPATAPLVNAILDWLMIETVRDEGEK